MNSGVASCPRLESKSAYQASPSLETLSVSIWASGLNRCPSYVLPSVIHWPGSASAFEIRAASTAAGEAPAAACTLARTQARKDTH